MKIKLKYISLDEFKKFDKAFCEQEPLTFFDKQYKIVHRAEMYEYASEHVDLELILDEMVSSSESTPSAEEILSWSCSKPVKEPVKELTQAQKNGWPDWDKLPDAFIYASGSGEQFFFDKNQHPNDTRYVCDKNHTQSGYFSTPFQSLKKYGSMEGGWKFIKAIPPESEEEKALAQTIKLAEQDIAHKQRMIEQYAEKKDALKKKRYEG